MAQEIKIEKLAVFDLDDTIYDGNSHFSIVNSYYKTGFFTSIFMRMIGRLSIKLRLYITNMFYERIPASYRCGFKMPLRQDVVGLLREKQTEGYAVIIVSNAPKDLLDSAMERLKIKAYSADFFGKAKLVKSICTYQKLFVCTDNKSDMDLLKIADEAVITCRYKDKEYFRQKLDKNNYSFLFKRK